MLRYQEKPDEFWTDYPGMPFDITGLDSIQIEKNPIKNSLKTLFAGAAIDDNIEKILAALKESGQLENTIIIYTSDQGYF